MDYLLRAGLIGEEAPAIRDFLFANLCLPGTLNSTVYYDLSKHTAADPWKAARAALTKDAGAEIPI